MYDFSTILWKICTVQVSRGATTDSWKYTTCKIKKSRSVTGCSFSPYVHMFWSVTCLKCSWHIVASHSFIKNVPIQQKPSCRDLGLQGEPRLLQEAERCTFARWHESGLNKSNLLACQEGCCDSPSCCAGWVAASVSDSGKGAVGRWRI